MAFQLTHRDEQTLFALQKLPLTSQQLFKLSQTFSQSFPSERILRRRMRRLEEEGIVKRFHYAFPSAGRNPAFWRLTRTSYRLINGLTGEDPLPRRSFFAAMGVSLHFHTYRVAEVVVQMLVQAHRSGIEVADLSVETSLALHAGEWITPDASLSLQTEEGRPRRFHLEIDTSSERVATKMRLPSSIQKKLEFYERYRLTNPDPFRVLFVCTSSKQRAMNILHFGSGLTNNRSAQSVYAVYLPELLASQNCLHEPIFSNHLLQPVSLIRKPTRRADAESPTSEGIVAYLCQKEFRPVEVPATIGNHRTVGQCSTKSPHWHGPVIASG
jgi:DNA-binding Lrp family transcriptional regulator